MINRADTRYFKRLTPEFIASLFEGHDVPEYVKKRAILILKRFTIFGLCDGMYIANTIAYENGTGDGCGQFQEGEITQTDKIVAALMSAYGCNIFPSDREDLEEIIRTGELPKERMLKGLQNSIRERIEKIRTMSDMERIEFLYGEIGVTRDTIMHESM